MTTIDPYLQNNWTPSDANCTNLAKSRCIDFVNQQISNSKACTDQQQEAISFTNHEEISGAIMQQCRILQHNNELQCVTIHHSDDDNIHTHHKRFKATITSLKHKLLCNHTDLTTPSRRYFLTTWSLHGDPSIKQQMSMTHCLRLHTRDTIPPRIELDPNAQYICIIHGQYINIISRQHLIHNRITDIDQTELKRQGIHIDGTGCMYPNIFDVQWFRNKRFSQNLLLGVVIQESNCFKFTIIDCKNKRVRRRTINRNHLKCQFIKYPHLSRDVLWGMCDASQSKEISVGITESGSKSTDIGLEKFAQYYLLRKNENESKSWVKSAPNGLYLAHFSGMNKSKTEEDLEDKKVSYRLGVIKIPDNVSMDSGMDDSDVTITFRTKPCGFSIGGDENERNARVRKIVSDSMNEVYIKSGLKVGLWIHTVNMKVVDNNAYSSILNLIRRAPVPLTIGFRHKPPSTSITPQRLGIRFWYNTPLALDNDTVCNGMHWLSNDMAVCVIDSRLYVLAQNSGARWRTKVLNAWMTHAYGNVNRDMRGIVHKFIGFDLDYVYDISDLNNEKTMIDFCYFKNESIYCLYQDNKKHNKLIVL
eukprot:195518_1